MKKEHRYKYGIQTGTMKSDIPPVQNNFQVVESEECWDDEDVPTYDPQKYVENAPVLRTLHLEPPAARAASVSQSVVVASINWIWKQKSDFQL